MSHEMNHAKSLPGRREFLKSAGVAAAGLYLAGGKPLAMAQEPAVVFQRLFITLLGGRRRRGFHPL